MAGHQPNKSCVFLFTPQHNTDVSMGPDDQINVSPGYFVLQLQNIHTGIKLWQQCIENKMILF